MTALAVRLQNRKDVLVEGGRQAWSCSLGLDFDRGGARTSLTLLRRDTNSLHWKNRRHRKEENNRQRDLCAAGGMPTHSHASGAHFLWLRNPRGLRLTQSGSCRLQSDANQTSWVVFCAHVRAACLPDPALESSDRYNGCCPTIANSSSRSPSFSQTSCCSIWQEWDWTDGHCSGEQHGRCLTVQDEGLRSGFLVPVAEQWDGWVAR